MGKFRNVVVHQYEKMELAIVVLILHKNLDDFGKYKKAMNNYLSLKK